MIISRSTRLLLDQYRISSRSLLEHLPTRSLLDFFDSQKLSCRSPDRCRPPRPLDRLVPDCLIRLDWVDLIENGNLTVVECYAHCIFFSLWLSLLCNQLSLFCWLVWSGKPQGLCQQWGRCQEIDQNLRNCLEKISSQMAVLLNSCLGQHQCLVVW